MYETYRNQAYHARIQLAVLDHNHHIDKQEAHNKDCGLMYARKFRKQAKKWDATPLMMSKDISELLKEIEGTKTCCLYWHKAQKVTTIKLSGKNQKHHWQYCS